MAVYWMTEALPLAVTSFFPLFLFPLLGVRKAKDVGPNYLKVCATDFYGWTVVLGHELLVPRQSNDGLGRRGVRTAPTCRVECPTIDGLQSEMVMWPGHKRTAGDY